jgi:hypothetical protein
MTRKQCSIEGTLYSTSTRLLQIKYTLLAVEVGFKADLQGERTDTHQLNSEMQSALICAHFFLCRYMGRSERPYNMSHN